MRTKAIMEENEDVKSSVEGFLKLYEDEWNERISVKARHTLYTAKFNKPLLLPIVEDVVLLHNFLQQRIGQVKDSSLDNGEKYRELVELLLTQIILFNRRRSGEAQRIKLKDMEILDNKSQPDRDILNCLPPLEQELCSSHERIEVQGKRGNKVPVLFTKQMMVNMKYLLSCRASAKIESEYVFGKHNSSHPLRGSDCVRKFSKDCGAKHPENITSTKLRKQLATLTQVLGLSEVGQDILAKFMGHDIRVHRQFYRLSDDTLQLAKVTKVLHCINSGKTSEVRGKDFDGINFVGNEIVEEESDEDSTEDEDSDNPYDGINDDGRPTWEPQSQRRSVSARKIWSEEEKQAAKRQLLKYLKEKSLPGKKACDEAKRNEPVLYSRTWIEIKNFVRNQNLKGNKNRP